MMSEARPLDAKPGSILARQNFSMIACTNVLIGPMCRLNLF